MILVAFTCFLSGCSSTKSDYEIARNNDTIRAYQGFLDQHPTSELTDPAKQRIAELQAQEKVEQRIQSNWGNLRAGMTEEQVGELLGKLDSKVWSWRTNIQGSENLQTGEVGPTTVTTIFTHGKYILKYIGVKLTDWSPR